MKKILTICFVVFQYLSAQAQDMNIIPQPLTVKLYEDGKTFFLSPATQLVLIGNNLERSAAIFNDYLQNFFQFKLKVVKTSTSSNVIRLRYDKADKERPGAYNINITENGIDIDGENEAGVFNGLQTIIQMLPVAGYKEVADKKINLPHLLIEDAPRFTYRGMHLDVSRHFFPVSFIKKYIDYLSLHKFNKFHWHLTDDQGWRIEIKKYPKLTSVGGWRNGTIIGRYPGTGNDSLKYGGFYTQAEIKEVVNYAADRFIDVIPEIEMPGHASAAIAAYPQLSCFPEIPTFKFFPKECKWNGDVNGKQVQQTWGVFDDVFCAGNDSTFIFLQNVLDEVLALFPSKYIHVGGDECPKENWKKCDKCQLRMKNENLSDEHHLQSYFIQRMEKYLNNKGRTLIGWDEILEGGLAPNAVVMSWRGEAGGIQAAQEGHNVIMTPGNPVYFDHTQSENEDSVTIGGFNPLEKVYAYEPIPAKLADTAAKYILGAQANMWAEYYKNTSKVEYMLFPRISALSEVLWSYKENKSWENFEKKLMAQFKRYDLWKVNYGKAYFDLKATVSPTQNYTGLSWNLESKTKADDILIYKWVKNGTADGEIVSNKGQCERIINSSGLYYGSLQDKTEVKSLLKQEFIFNKATGKKITLNNPASDKYPGDGAFTLVNGVQNVKGMSKTKEFLGFNGTDCEAVIDLGKQENISFVKVHYLHHPGSWIHQPSAVSILVSNDGVNFSPVAISNPRIANNEAINEFLSPATARYVKIKVANFGTIPAGNQGAGNKAWLFVDEIEVN